MVDLKAEIETYFRDLYAQGTGRPCAAEDAQPDPDGRRIAFTGSFLPELEGAPQTRIGIVERGGAAIRFTGAGAHSERHPRWSPDGTQLAFLSDAVRAGIFGLWIEDAEGRSLVAALEGTIEYFAWSPAGTALLLAVADLGADVAGAHGSGKLPGSVSRGAAWEPIVHSGEAEPGRRLWIYSLGTRRLRPLTPAWNIWEACWCGEDAVLAIASESPSEGAWYRARLVRVNLRAEDDVRTVRRSEVQLALPAATRSGKRSAFVEAFCSDRLVVAGTCFVRTGEEEPRAIQTRGVDVTHIAWRNDDVLLYVGLRDLETVAGEYDARTGEIRELWVSTRSCGTRYPQAEPVGADGLVMVHHGYDRFYEIAIVENGSIAWKLPLENDRCEKLRRAGGTVRAYVWTARDGLEVQGLLALPDSGGPHPLVVLVHGGPVWAFRNVWSMFYVWTPLLVRLGYAVLHPNPRGSGGRGQAFARMVRGDVCGEDAFDILCGIDRLVEEGIVDTERVAAMGQSYGGLMSAWFVTQTDRFAAAIPISPVVDWYSQHFTSNIAEFDAMILADDPLSAGRYFQRSPLFHVRNAKTPCLCIAGLQDKCTPPGQAIEFHRALLEQGVRSELVLYPLEGHHRNDVRAQIDECGRIMRFLQRHVAARADRDS